MVVVDIEGSSLGLSNRESMLEAALILVEVAFLELAVEERMQVIIAHTEAGLVAAVIESKQVIN